MRTATETAIANAEIDAYKQGVRDAFNAAIRITEMAHRANADPAVALKHALALFQETT